MSARIAHNQNQGDHKGTPLHTNCGLLKIRVSANGHTGRLSSKVKEEIKWRKQ